MKLALLLCLALVGRAQADILPRAAPPPAPVKAGADTLAAIEHAGVLRCGVITAAEDYSTASTHGDLSAFGAGLCRATAAALSVRAAITAYPDDAHALRALHAGGIDLLYGVTPDPASALPYDVAFGPVA